MDLEKAFVNWRYLAKCLGAFHFVLKFKSVKEIFTKMYLQ